MSRVVATNQEEILKCFIFLTPRVLRRLCGEYVSLLILDKKR